MRAAQRSARPGSARSSRAPSSRAPSSRAASSRAPSGSAASGRTRPGSARPRVGSSLTVMRSVTVVRLVTVSRSSASDASRRFPLKWIAKRAFSIPNEVAVHDERWHRTTRAPTALTSAGSKGDIARQGSSGSLSRSTSLRMVGLRAAAHQAAVARAGVAAARVTVPRAPVPAARATAAQECAASTRVYSTPPANSVGAVRQGWDDAPAASSRSLMPCAALVSARSWMLRQRKQLAGTRAGGAQQGGQQATPFRATSLPGKGNASRSSCASLIS